MHFKYRSIELTIQAYFGQCKYIEHLPKKLYNTERDVASDILFALILMSSFLCDYMINEL